MSDFQFSEENNLIKQTSQTNTSRSTKGGMIGFLVEKGFVKNENIAEKVLLVFSFIIIIITVLVLIFYVFDVKIGKKQNQPKKDTKERVQRNNLNQPIKNLP